VRRTSLPLLVTFGVLAALSSACTRAQARVNPDVAPLDVPAPPPRNVEATEEPPRLPATATEETPRPITPPPRLPTTPAQQRPEPARPEPVRVEPPPPVEPARPADDTRGQPPATLQTTPAERESQVERNINDTLSRATASLNRIDYRALNPNAQTQYDQAMRFISQARDALRDRNLVFANNLADKALTLAAQLSGR